LTGGAFATADCAQGRRLFELDPRGLPLFAHCFSDAAFGLASGAGRTVIAGTLLSETSVGGPVMAPGNFMASYDASGAWTSQATTSGPGWRAFGPVGIDPLGWTILSGAFDTPFALPGPMMLDTAGDVPPNTLFIAKILPMR